MTQPINQHYVPQWYQERFALPDDRKKSVMFRRIGTRRPWAPTIPRNLCSENFYNAFKDPTTGQWNHAYDEFAARFENARDTVVSKICKSENIAVEDREKLAMFTALMIQGVPSFRNNIGNFVERVGDSMLELNYIQFKKNPALLEAYKKRLNLPAHLTPEDLNPANMKAKANKAYVMGMSLEHLGLGSQMIFDMGWSICVSHPDHTFITSDRPAVLYEPDPKYPMFMGVGLASQTAVLQLPLSKNHALVASHAFGKEYFGYADVAETEVAAMNLKQAQYADKVVIAATDTFPGHAYVNQMIDAREKSYGIHSGRD